jgi:hypothetical protein
VSRVPGAACALALGVVGGAACAGPQVSATQALGEPIRVESGQFFAGSLPGLPPIAESADGGDAGASVSPEVTDVSLANTAIAPGSAGVLISGHATATAQAVALRFGDLGSGYWVVPVGPPDPTDGNLPTWQFLADFGRDIAPGFHDLLFAAIDAGGSSGTQYDQPVCVDTPVPDNLNVCVPKRPPPAAVLSLTWDAPVDLDLIVEDPSGAFVGGKIRALGIEGGVPASPSATAANGVLDRDSNANCVIDEIDREDIVWQTEPPRGTYQVWVDMFSACHQPAASFSVALWRSEPRPDGGAQELVEQQPVVAVGDLTASQATGGAGLGLYVGAFVLH